MLNGLVRNWMTSRVVTVTPETRLNDARRIMDAEKIRALPVMKNDQLIGIVTRRGLLRADLSPLDAEAWRKANEELKDLTIGDIMTTSVLTILPESPLPKAARIMMENKITALPVVDRSGALVGILTSSDLFRVVIDELPVLREDVRVKDYMSSEIVSITPDTSLLEAHRLMGVKRIRSLLVMENEDLLGVVTRTDLMSSDPPRVTNRYQQELSLQIETTDVAKVMSTQLITIVESEPITLAARLMLDNKIHCLPVMNAEAKVAGILTETDLFRLVVQKFF